MLPSRHAVGRLLMIISIVSAGLVGDARADDVEIRMGPWGGNFKIHKQWRTVPGCADYMWHRYFGGGEPFPQGGYGFNELSPSGPATATPLTYEEQERRLITAFAKNGLSLQNMGEHRSLSEIKRLAAGLPNGSKIPIYGYNHETGQAFWVAGTVENGEVQLVGTNMANEQLEHLVAAMKRSGLSYLRVYHATPQASRALHELGNAVAAGEIRLSSKGAFKSLGKGADGKPVWVHVGASGQAVSEGRTAANMSKVSRVPGGGKARRVGGGIVLYLIGTNDEVQEIAGEGLEYVPPVRDGLMVFDQFFGSPINVHWSAVHGTAGVDWNENWLPIKTEKLMIHDLESGYPWERARRDAAVEAIASGKPTPEHVALYGEMAGWNMAMGVGPPTPKPGWYKWIESLFGK